MCSLFLSIWQLIPNYKNCITEYQFNFNRFFLNSCKIIAIWSTHRHFGQCCLVRPLSWSLTKLVRVAIAHTVSLMATHWCQSHKSSFMCDLRVLPVCTGILRMLNFISTLPLFIRISFDQIYDVKSKGHIEHLNQMKGTNALCYPMPPTRETYLLMFSFKMRPISISVETPMWQNTADK